MLQAIALSVLLLAPIGQINETETLSEPSAGFKLPFPTAETVEATMAPSLVTQPGDLLPAILTALDPAASRSLRIVAINELGMLRDDSLVPVFTALLYHPSPRLQRAATTALGRVTDSTASRLLAEVVRSWGDDVAATAVTALGMQQTALAGNLLLQLQRDEKLADGRRDNALEALKAWYPAIYDRHRPAPTIQNDGLPFLIVASAELGAVDMLAVGLLGMNPEIGGPLGFVSGGVLGAAAGYLLGKDTPMSLTQGYRTFSYQNWGLGIGLSLGAAIVSDHPFDSVQNEDRLVAGLAALGATAGFGIGLADDAPLSLARQAMVDVSGFAGLSVAAGILLWAPSSDKSLPAVIIADSGALIGLTASRLLIPKLRLEPDDGILLASAPLLGAWFAPWTAYAVDREAPGERIAGWFFMGTGLGWTTGLVLADRLEDTSATVMQANIFTVYGSALGAGIPMAAGRTARNADAFVVPMLAGGAGAFVLGAVTAPYTEYQGADLSLILGSTVFGAWQGAGFAGYSDLPGSRILGYGYIGATAGAALALGVTQAYDVTPALSSAIFSGQALGTWVGWVGGLRADLDDDNLLLASLVGTDVGLVTTALLVGPLDVAPERIGWAGVGGLVGSGLFATGAALFSPSLQSVQTATLAGTIVGAGAAGYFAPGVSVAPRASLPETGLRFAGVQPWLYGESSGSSARGMSFNFLLP
jgi:hypothetical protein